MEHGRRPLIAGMIDGDGDLYRLGPRRLSRTRTPTIAVGMQNPEGHAGPNGGTAIAGAEGRMHFGNPPVW